ncbi:MAG: PAS domain S-box protein, partial [Bacteroidota bacterium]
MDFKNLSKEDLLEEIKRLNEQISEKSSESESRLQALFNAMTDIVFEMDYDGKYIDIAPTSANLMYKIPSETIGKKLHDIFPKQEADVFLNFIRTCIDENKTATIKYPLIINNETIWFEGKASPKTKISVIYIARDITVEEKTKLALDETETRYRETVDMLPQIVFEINLAGKVIFVNKYALDTFGYSQEEISNNFSFKEILAPEDRERALKNVQNMLIGHKPEDTEYTALRKDGSTFTCIIYSSNIIKNGRPAGLRGIIIDITKQKQAEEDALITKIKIEESEARFRAISEQSTEGITVADKDGNYVFVNTTFCKMTKYSKEELLEMTVFDMLENPDGILIDEKLFGIPTQFMLKDKHNRAFPIEIIVNTISIESEKLFMGVVNDITERKKAEKERIEHKVKIEKSEKKFRELFEKSGDAILILENGIFIDCNQATVEILNYNSKEE